MDGIEMYESESGDVVLGVRADEDTVWLTLDQMAAVFGRDDSTVSAHIANVFREGKLLRDSVIANSATTASDGKTYQVTHYNLDVLISVGSRVKSIQGVRLRRWATEVLRRYLIDGAAVNERRLAELGQVVSILARSHNQLAEGIADVVSVYLPGLELLHDCDEGLVAHGTEGDPRVGADAGRSSLSDCDCSCGVCRYALAGRERGDALEVIIAAINRPVRHILARRRTPSTSLTV